MTNKLRAPRTNCKEVRLFWRHCAADIAPEKQQVILLQLRIMKLMQVSNELNRARPRVRYERPSEDLRANIEIIYMRES